MSEFASSAPFPPADEEVAITDLELRALLTQARATDDGTLHRLITSYVTLRRVAADVIASIEARDGGAAVARSPLLLRARSLAGGPSRTTNPQPLRGQS